MTANKPVSEEPLAYWVHKGPKSVISKSTYVCLQPIVTEYFIKKANNSELQIIEPFLHCLLL